MTIDRWDLGTEVLFFSRFPLRDQQDIYWTVGRVKVTMKDYTIK